MTEIQIELSLVKSATRCTFKTVNFMFQNGFQIWLDQVDQVRTALGICLKLFLGSASLDADLFPWNILPKWWQDVHLLLWP